MELSIGLKGRANTVVNPDNTALALGSGSLQVFATPAMVALIEEAAVNALNLEGENTSVGTLLEIQHVAATPVGMKAWAEAELIEIDRRRLIFKVSAYDEAGKIGEGRHERFLINSIQFMEKVLAKNRG